LLKKPKAKLRARRLSKEDVALLLGRRDEQPQHDERRDNGSKDADARGVSATGRRP
jgi:hypothetical protein